MKTYLITAMVCVFLSLTVQTKANTTYQNNASYPLDADNTTQAVWQEREVRFWHTGAKTRYTCGAIEQRLKALLVHFGAQEKPSVRATGCFNGLGYAPQAISISMKFSVPVELANADNTQAPFAAQVKSVAVSNNRPRLIESFDCELIDSFARQVLPSFEQESVRNTAACFRRQSSLHAWRVESKVLVPATTLLRSL